MKTILILLTLITSFTINNEWKRRIDLKSKTDLPFELIEDTHSTKPFVYVDDILKDYLSIYAYEDIGGQKIFYHNYVVDCELFRCFDLGDKKIELLDIQICGPEFSRHVLMTLDSNYQPVDTLEVAIDGSCLAGCGNMLSKQYRLHENLELEVYQLIPTAGKIIEFLSKWEHAELQRIDTHYLIDENGKFIKKSETHYKPQTYDIHVLSQKEYNIWNGTEIKLEQKE